MIKQIFTTDSKFWTQSQNDEVSLFFQLNPFFNKFYQPQHFQELVSMYLYTKIAKGSQLILENNKKPQAIVLLSGKLQIFKKVYKQKVRKIKTKKNDQIQSKRETQILVEYENFKLLSQQTQTINVSFDCRLTSIGNQDAQILYVPTWLFERYMKTVENRKIQLVVKELINFFPKVQKKVLVSLANDCTIKDLRINDYVYKLGSQPVKIYLLLEGTIIIQKGRDSHNKSMEAINVQSPSIFGNRDIKLSQRISSVMITSAYAKILSIPKKQFLRFAQENLDELKLHYEQQRECTLPQLKTNKKSMYLAEERHNIERFIPRNNYINNEKLIEMKLMRDCHVLVNLSPKKSKTSRFQNGKNDYSKDYTKDQFQEKIKLFHKIRPQVKRIGLNNPIINLTPFKPHNLRHSLGSLSDSLIDFFFTLLNMKKNKVYGGILNSTKMIRLRQLAQDFFYCSFFQIISTNQLKNKQNNVTGYRASFFFFYGTISPINPIAAKTLTKKLHLVDQIKLKTTKMSLIKGGIHPPIIQVKNETIFKGKTQYPNKLALWKNDLCSIQKIHIRSEKVCVQPDDNRPDPHNDKNRGNDGLL